MTIAQLTPWVILLIALSFMILWRRRGHKVRVGRLWVSPVLLAILVIVSIVAQPHTAFQAFNYLIFAGVTLLGGASGLVRARSMVLSIDPADGSVLSYTDGVAILLLVALIAARTGARTLAELGQVELPVIADATMLFAVSMVAVQRYFTWLRIKAMRPARQRQLAR